MDEIETVEKISDDLVEEKKSAKEILIEMKDISGAMMDLAYSALLLNSRDLADTVVELEAEMDVLRYEIEIKTMLSARNRQDAEDLTAILRVAYAAEIISDAAKDIVDVVLRGEADHPLLREMITQADEVILKAQIKQNSVLANNSLLDLRLATRTGMYIVAIRRGSKWTYRPKKDFVLLVGDVILASGGKENAEFLKKLASGKLKKIC
ncbi:MAG: potassium channel protein [Candidatus Altiarchaeota archaeon]|nr:potassium channel protein [Candidatus Altiarchaeota archaeon]